MSEAKSIPASVAPSPGGEGSGIGSGYYGELSPEQQEILDKYLVDSAAIRSKFYPDGADYLDENNEKAKNPNKIIFEALRFLRARKFDAEKSLAMYSAHMEWRKKFEVDKILKEKYPPPKYELVNKIIPHKQIGFDKEGRPIVYEKLGQVDPVALMNLVNADEYLKVHICKYEAIWASMDAQSKTRGKHIETFTLVLDLKGVKIDTSKTTGYLKLCSENDADNFPERLGKLVIINTPLLFMAIWKIAQAFIDEKTKKKITIVYGNPLNDLEKLIDNSVIPKEYGGSNEDHVPTFDLSNLSLQDLTGQDHQSETLEATVGAGKSFPSVFSISQDCTFYWFFRVNGGADIETKITFTPKSGESVQVSSQRSSTDQGSFVAPSDGEILFELNNSFSWITAKTVKYSVTIPPKSTDQ